MDLALFTFLMRIVFMGTPPAAVPSLERLIADGHEIAAVYTQPDRPSGRGNKITFSPVKQAALGHELSVFQPEKVRTPEALELFLSHEADLAVVVAYGRILPETFLTAFQRGALNVTVLDNSTNKPIRGATVEVIETKQKAKRSLLLEKLV